MQKKYTEGLQKEKQTYQAISLQLLDKTPFLGGKAKHHIVLNSSLLLFFRDCLDFPHLDWGVYYPDQLTSFSL